MFPKFEHGQIVIYVQNFFLYFEFEDFLTLFRTTVVLKSVSFVLLDLLLHSLCMMTCICNILYYSLLENAYNFNTITT